MAFSAKDFLAAHEPWSFSDGRGRAHVARELGYREVLQWMSRFEWAGSDIWKQERVTSRLLRRLFPARPRYWFTVVRKRALVVGLPLCAVTALFAFRHDVVPEVVTAILALLATIGPGEPDPWYEFQRLPGPAQAAGIASFFLRAGLVMPVPRTKTTTTGSSDKSSPCNVTPRPSRTSVA